jgi:hypothetical protein
MLIASSRIYAAVSQLADLAIELVKLIEVAFGNRTLNYPCGFFS